MEIKLTETDNELHQILSLQYENYVANVSKESKNIEGFVAVQHDFDQLKKMNKAAKQVIAVDGGKVIGYALVMMKEFKDLIPILKPMFDTIESIEYKGVPLNNRKYYVMGQICIATAYRGKGIFGLLYQKHQDVYSQKYDICLTEVSSSNPRSLRAHKKLGFKTIHTFKDLTDEWNILCWDWDDKTSTNSYKKD